MEFLCNSSSGRIQLKEFWNLGSVIFVIDEAQLSYLDELFWIECIKEQKTRTSGPHFVLLSSFGSSSPTVLRIKGSAPIDLSSLLPQVDSATDISLCLNFEEVQDLRSAMIGTRTFKVDESILKHRFTLTNGHPGLTRALLKSFFDRAVRGNLNVCKYLSWLLIRIACTGYPSIDPFLRTSNYCTCHPIF
jgi:hypothetical protein